MHILNYNKSNKDHQKGLGKAIKKMFSPQPKRISKNRREDMERVAESEIVPNWHVFISISAEKSMEKGGEVVKVGIVIPLEEPITFFLISATKMNFEKPPVGGGACG